MSVHRSKNRCNRLQTGLQKYKLFPTCARTTAGVHSNEVCLTEIVVQF